MHGVCGYPDNSPPGQFAPDNLPPIFKQLAPRSFIHYRATWAAEYMKPRLNIIQIILCSFIYYRVCRLGASCLGWIVQGVENGIISMVTIANLLR